MSSLTGLTINQSLKDLCLEIQNTDDFNVWIQLPQVQHHHLQERLSRREMLVCELQFSLIRKEYKYYHEISQLYNLIRQSIFWKIYDPPKYVRRQAIIILARLKRMCGTLLSNLERDYNTKDCILLNLHKLFDIIYMSTSQELTSTLLAYCDILSELRSMINGKRCENENLVKLRTMDKCEIDGILLPLQRLAEQKSTLLKICDDLRDQRQLAKAHRALDNIAAVLDGCYECLTCLHGPSYVANIDNILDLSWKPSSLKYRKQRAHLVLPRPQVSIREGPMVSKPSKVTFEIDDHKRKESVEDLYELVEIPLNYTCINITSKLLEQSFEYTPLYQAISSKSDQSHLGRQDDEKSLYEYNKCCNTTYMRTLWCQIEPVISTGLLDKLTIDERSLMETKFEIISSEVSYLKSLCVLITIFYESTEIRRLIGNEDMTSLFSNITQVKEVSEKFLDDVAYSLSKDVLMSDICSLVRVHTLTNFRIFVTYCAHQTNIHQTFQRLVSQNDELVELLGNLETSSSCQGYSLISFLTLPLQRVTRLPLLLQAILRKLPDHSSLEYHEASDAYKALQQLVKDCNEAVTKPDKKFLTKRNKSIDKKNKLK